MKIFFYPPPQSYGRAGEPIFLTGFLAVFIGVSQAKQPVFQEPKTPLRQPFF